MNPRTLRWGLLALAAAVLLSVIVSLRRSPAPPPPAPAPPAAPLAGTAGEDLVYRKIVDGQERGIVRAQAFVGQEKEGTRLKSVDATFQHVYEGKPGHTTVVADDCLYDAEKQKASFHGNVKVTTSEGLELTAPSLIYNGTREMTKSEDAVEFRMKAVSGRSLGMVYEAAIGQLTLDRDVYLRIEHEDGPPTEIRSGNATASRSEALMRFAGGVEVTRGPETLKAQRLNLNLSTDLAFVYRAVAVDDMELRASGSPTAPPRPNERPRLLRGRKLDLWFHADTHKLREAMAGPDASLEMPSAAGEERSLAARFIRLIFDGEGRLGEIQGLKDAVLVARSRAGRPTGGRTVKCFTLIGRTDPATGELRDMDFQGGVEIAEPKRRATAQGGHFEERGQILSLAGRARMVDEAQGSDLSADAIEVQGQSGNVAARENVRHLVTPRTKGGPFGGSQVWQMSSRLFDYDLSQKTGRYRENALLRAGDDEVRGALIIVDEAKPGERRLNASGGVRSVLHSRPGGAERPERKGGRRPIETESAEMLYEESRHTVVYKGDVRIRQGDVTTRSPEATAFLSADGSRLERVVAGEPVEVQQGRRRASGTRGTYIPEQETMVLVGEKVVLEDPKQRLQGRSLTFRAGDDTILVDGREVERTESVFRREPPRP